MWSGPRNISTAMMRAWGNRADTQVCDEPLYAHYLARTGLAHPGAEEVLRHHEQDWRKVVDGLTGPLSEGKRVFYQKHMAHHLLDNIDRAWLDRVTNCFLIRDPREMLASLSQHLPRPTLEDTGLPQQVEILRLVRERTGQNPPVIDARDVLEDPERMLRSLCEAIGVDFDDSMLAWPPGPRSTDGTWARHWYSAVNRSTGFGPYRPRPDPLPSALEPLHAETRRYYELLYSLRLQRHDRQTDASR